METKSTWDINQANLDSPTYNQSNRKY